MSIVRPASQEGWSVLSMANKKQIEVVPPAEEPEEMPLPSDPKVIFLGGLFTLALLAAVSVAAEISAASISRSSPINQHGPVLAALKGVSHNLGSASGRVIPKLQLWQIRPQ